MIQFNNCDNVIVFGNGKILGQGSFWRPNNEYDIYLFYFIVDFYLSFYFNLKYFFYL